MERLTVKSDKQILVDWYYQQVANACGPDAEIHITADLVEKDFCVQVQERLAYRSNL